MSQTIDLPLLQEDCVETRDETRFVACPNCGMHGLIILKDGRRSGQQFLTKPGALAEVERILSLSLIDSEEASALRDQIAESNLSDDGEEGVESDEEIPPIIAIAIAVSLGEILSAMSNDPDDDPSLRKMRRDQRRAHLN